MRLIYKYIRRKRLDIWDFLIVPVTFLLLIPFISLLQDLGDEGIILHAAWRMLRGEIPYRDFFEFYPPLSFIILKNWMIIFGASLTSVHLLIVLIITATAWFIFRCCRIVSGRPDLSISLTILWIVAILGDVRVYHGYIANMFSMIALWGILSPRKYTGPVTAGFAAGATLLTTTHKGILIAVAGFISLLMSKNLLKTTYYVAIFLILLIITVIFLWSSGAALQAFDQIILYPILNYSDIQPVAFGSWVSLGTIFSVGVFPLIACLLMLEFWRHRLSLLSRTHFTPLLFFAIAGFVGCFPRPDAFHISLCVPLGLPLLATLLNNLLPKKTIVSAVLGNSIFFIFLLACFSSIKEFNQSEFSDKNIKTSAGTIIIRPESLRGGAVDIVEKLQSLPPKTTVFFYPNMPMLPFITGKSHPARLDVLVPEYTTPAQYRDTCLEVMKYADFIVIDEQQIQPSYYHLWFPAMKNPSPPEKIAFEHAIENGFSLENRYGAFTLRRRTTASTSLCKNINPSL